MWGGHEPGSGVWELRVGCGPAVVVRARLTVLRSVWESRGYVGCGTQGAAVGWWQGALWGRNAARFQLLLFCLLNWLRTRRLN